MTVTIMRITIGVVTINENNAIMAPEKIDMIVTSKKIIGINMMKAVNLDNPALRHFPILAKPSFWISVTALAADPMAAGKLIKKRR
jgi:hypothetical protein